VLSKVSVGDDHLLQCVDPRSGYPARCLDFSRCRRFCFVATTGRWCWPNEVDASAYSGAVSKNSVVRRSAETAGRHELRTGPDFDDPLACGVRTVGVVWIVDEQQRWIVGTGRNSGGLTRSAPIRLSDRHLRHCARLWTRLGPSRNLLCSGVSSRRSPGAVRLG
jgi:hypothetical protein